MTSPAVPIFRGYLANYDRTSHTVTIRASRDSWQSVTGGKLLAIGAISVGTAAVIALLGIIVGFVGSSFVTNVTSSIDYDLAYPSSKSLLVTKVMVTALVCCFFGVVGYAIGVLTKSISWPMVLAAIVLFLVPFMSAWDPRNLLAVIGVAVFDFWGQFELRPPIPVGLSTSVVALLGYATVALAFVLWRARRAPLH